MEKINTKLNLCETCRLDFPTCSQDTIKFGDGFGNDNVYECSSYTGRPTKKFLTPTTKGD